LVGVVIYALMILNLVLSLARLGGWWSVVVGVGIAIVQALIIAIFSMELAVSRRSVLVVAIVVPLFVILMVSLTTTDIYTRSPPALLPPELQPALPVPPPSAP
jgi:caa(3)-type oxidase subunit IV